MKHVAVISLLLCTLFAFAPVQATSASDIVLDVFPGSNTWWLAFAVRKGDVDTQSVQIKDSKSSSYVNMAYTEGWGYWSYTSKSGELEFPVSVVLTSVDGEEVIIENAISSVSVGSIDTAVQYGSSIDPPTAPTTRPNKAASSKHTTTTTKAPKHSTTTTKVPSKAPTQSGKSTTTTKAPATKAPTTTKAATKAATTTKAPTTTKAASTSGGSGSGCSAGLKLMVPLYVDPGSAWDTVAASGAVVPTVAIINPDSGPGSGPDSSYTSGMNTLANAGVDMVGYVHTSYGARAIADVKADVDVYAEKFPHVVGIFVDETATASSELSYYTELYEYIMSFPGYKYTILNPGAVPASGYSAAATQIVTYEDTASGFASSQNPSGASCSNKNEYAVIAYSASSASSMESVVQAAVSKGYYGWVYATSGTLSGNTYGSLPSYYAQMASYIASSA